MGAVGRLDIAHVRCWAARQSTRQLASSTRSIVRRHSLLFLPPIPSVPSVSFPFFLQVWALQEGSTVHLGGKTNRAKYSFQDELNEIVDSIPEVKSVEPTPEVKTVEETKEAAEAVGKST